MAIQNDLRDLVYLTLGVKKAADEFTFNNFGIEKTHIPYELLWTLPNDFPGGKVYVVAGVPGDLEVINRQNATAAREWSVMVGYQKGNVPREDNTVLDTLDNLVSELETMCRLEIDSNSEFSFTRLEYLKDENGVPFDFYGLREQSLYEAYFTAFYKLAQS